MPKAARYYLLSGYGYANIEKKERVTINHRFRIASVSKPITSAAILKLVESGKLSLTDRVFGKNGIFKGKYLKKKSGTNIELIEIRHLLKHTSAPEWRNNGRDPMFKYPKLGHDDLIRRILSERKIKNIPGAKYAYSNFGYCILGRVIERVSGQNYAKFVKNNVLSKFDSRSFKIGGDTRLDKAAREVTYYSGSGDWAYKMPVGRMDSHGGWISNAKGLVEFAHRVDGFSTPEDILQSQTVMIMKAGSKANKRYAMGWGVNFVKNSWHMGALPGTSSILVNTSNGMTWSVLTNGRSESKDYFADLDQLMWSIVKEIEL